MMIKSATKYDRIETADLKYLKKRRYDGNL